MQNDHVPEKKKTKAEQERQLEQALEDSFPASDPPAPAQAGSDIKKNLPDPKECAPSKS